MKITERDRELLERALDHASVTITSGISIVNTDTLALIARAIAVVREVPPGMRKVRSDMGALRQESAMLESRVGGAVVP